MECLSLKEIVGAIDGNILNCCDIDDTYIEQISIDTRTLRKGDLFFAINGEHDDGHDYLEIAEKKGAKVLIVSQDYKSDSIPIIKVTSTKDALLKLALYYRDKFNVKIIAICGECGKTTTKDMLNFVLSCKYKVLSNDKNFNNRIGLPLSVFNIGKEDRYAIFELGSSKKEGLGLLSKIIKPDYVIITGDEMNDDKSSLYCEVFDNMKKGGTVIVDNNYNINIHQDINIINVGFNKKDNDYLFATKIQVLEDGVKFHIINKENQKYKVFLPVLGKHNVSNALKVIGCCSLLGFSYEDIVKELGFFIGTPLRCEKFIVNGVNFIKDYFSSNKRSLQAAFDLLDSFPLESNKIAIIGDLEEDVNITNDIVEIAEYCKNKDVDLIIFIGEQSEIFKKNYEGNCICFKDKDSALRYLEGYVLEGKINSKDVILLKAKRIQKFENLFTHFRNFLNSKINDTILRVPSTAAKMYVDVTAMKHNLAQIKRAIGDDVQIMPIIKANAYSLGTDIVTNVYGETSFLAVADGKEAVLMKNAFPNSKIMILYQPHFGDIECIIENDFIVGVCSLSFIERLNREAARAKKVINIHIEIDTGSGRLGIMLHECEEFINQVKEYSHIEVQGLYMHYICADSFDLNDIEFTKLQTKRFKDAIDIIEKSYGFIQYKHACSSSAIFNQNAAHFNMVRPGYMLYGYYPSKELKNIVKLKPALRLITEIVYLKDVPKDTPISYSRTFITKQDTKVATVSIGYSDGFSRMMSNTGFMVVNGQLAPIIGSVCMDLCMLDVTDIEGDIYEGQEVAIFDNVNITLEDIADKCNTIGYEIISRLEDKVERIEEI